MIAAVPTGVDPASLVIAFAFGALSFLSPCVLPLVPGYLGLMSGYSATDLAEGRASTARMLRVTGLFVAGFTTVFVALGAGATAFGSFLLRNQNLATRIAGWFIVVVGVFVAVTAVWTPRVFLPLLRERRFDLRPSRLGHWAPPLMGIAFGFAWTPCIGPVLAAIFTIAATQRTVGQGMVLLFVYSLGLGVPFLAAALGMSRAYGAFGWFRRHARPITVVSGALLAGFGVLMITGRVTALSNWFIDVLEAIGLDSLSTI